MEVRFVEGKDCALRMGALKGLNSATMLRFDKDSIPKSALNKKRYWHEEVESKAFYQFLKWKREKLRGSTVRCARGLSRG